MNKILKRDEYINEVYNPMMEQKEEQQKYEELVVVNEGLLKTLFGIAKNMFKKDWSTIKGDQTIIRIYKELDDKLTGFSLMKLSKKSECNQIRQALVDFADDWYDYKMNKAKDKDEDPVPSKSMKFKDETLKSNLEACEKKIRDIAGKDEQMLSWANRLKEDMRIVINRSILDSVENEDTKKEIEEMIKDADQKREEINKKMEQFQNDQLKEIQSEREKLITDMDSALVRTDLGDKAVEELCGEFEKTKDKNGKSNKARFKKDETLGLKALYDDDAIASDKFKTAYALMDSIYNSLKDGKVVEKFKETPGKSVQAMCISINAFIKYCIYGDTDYSKALPIMAKCAIISDGSISYNLPLNDKTGDDAGNYFTDIAKIITNGEMKDTENKPIELPDDFKKNSKTLLDKIIDEAKKLKEKSENDYNENLKKLKLDEEK